MSYDYEYGYQTLPNVAEDEIFLGILVAMLAIFAVVLLIGLAFWVIRSLSLYTIARRRGVRNAWLSWIPIGAHWILGSISDQYQHLVQGKVTSRRKILLGLSVASFVAGAAYVVMTVMVAVMAEPEGQMILTPLVILIPYLLFLGVSITALVFYHMSNYDLYRSCDPKNAVAFLVIGIFIPVTEPFFYLVNRRKDRGMVVPSPVTPEPAELPRANPEF